MKQLLGGDDWPCLPHSLHKCFRPHTHTETETCISKVPLQYCLKSRELEATIGQRTGWLYDHLQLQRAKHQEGKLASTPRGEH